jgi:hypothetical protein
VIGLCVLFAFKNLTDGSTGAETTSSRVNIGCGGGSAIVER